jgi:hypothetical protein
MRGRKTPAGDTEILAQSVLGENMNRRQNRLSVDDRSGLIVWSAFIQQEDLWSMPDDPDTMSGRDFVSQKNVSHTIPYIVWIWSTLYIDNISGCQSFRIAVQVADDVPPISKKREEGKNAGSRLNWSSGF